MVLKRNIILIAIAFVFLAVAGILIFCVPSLFVEEFHYVNVDLSNGALTVTADPADLFEKTTSRWTDISATFRNSEQNDCQVTVSSSTLDKSFNLASGAEYGLIIPKHEDVAMTFCGVNKTIRIN